MGGATECSTVRSPCNNIIGKVKVGIPERGIELDGAVVFVLDSLPTGSGRVVRHVFVKNEK